jgi:hypothetical protein
LSRLPSWSTVAATKQVLHQDDLDFAFLDVDVTNGKTFELAPWIRYQLPSIKKNARVRVREVWF